MQTYRWATLGCGVIANELAQALASRGQKLYSVANRTHAKAVAFAEKYGIEKVYDQIDDVFADENVDIIYISTPHNTHIQYLRKALAAGKHVLCAVVYDLRAGPDCVAGAVRAHRRGRAGGHPAEKQGAGDGLGHSLAPRQAAQAGHDCL